MAGDVDNLSGDPDAGLEVARLVGRALAVRGATRGEDPLVLRASVDAVSEEPVGLGGSQRVFVWRARAKLSFALREGTEKSAALVARSEATGTEDYVAGADLEATEVARRQALQRLLERLVADGLDRLSPVR